VKKEKALEFIPKFPELPENIQRQMLHLLRPFIIYDHKGNGRCTNCEAKLTFERGNTVHKAKRVCPICGAETTMIDSACGYNGNTIESRANALVFLAGGDGNLYIRCFALRMTFKHGELTPRIFRDETQRYVFTPDGSARFGAGYDLEERETSGGYKYYIKVLTGDWGVRSKMAEPKFNNNYAYNVLNTSAITETYLKYSAAEMLNFNADKLSPIAYLRFYKKHPGVERLVKCGMYDIVLHEVKVAYREESYWYYAAETPYGLNWKETEVHKMLGISKNALRLIRAGKISYSNYRIAAGEFPGISEEKQTAYARVVDNRFGSLEKITGQLKRGKKGETKLLNYLVKNDVKLRDYEDHIDNCRKLKYDLTDDIIAFPQHFWAAHDRAVLALQAIEEERLAKKNAELRKKFEKLYEKRRKLEFEYGDYVIVQPQSAEDIVREGKVLSHCVGGYAARHGAGELTIMFLRRKDEPNEPFYTIEVSKNYVLVQCRGYKNNTANNPVPEDVIAVEKAYREYLKELKQQELIAKNRKKAKEAKVQTQIGA